MKRWADAQAEPIQFYRDKASGKNMERPGWAKLEAARWCYGFNAL
ncbi:MAG TPA: hypothetical protein VFG20_13700 [Planctomycetaceae bacterium]|nr:hypothetical protein [Planctomycetaceae bacterium]